MAFASLLLESRQSTKYCTHPDATVSSHRVLFSSYTILDMLTCTTYPSNHTTQDASASRQSCLPSSVAQEAVNLDGIERATYQCSVWEALTKQDYRAPTRTTTLSLPTIVDHTNESAKSRICFNPQRFEMRLPASAETNAEGWGRPLTKTPQASYSVKLIHKTVVLNSRNGLFKCEA